MTRLRVVAESGPMVNKTLDDGSTVKEHQFKEFFDVEGWGGTGKGLAALRKGEAAYVQGDLRQSQPVQLDDGSTFYPKGGVGFGAERFGDVGGQGPELRSDLVGDMALVACACDGCCVAVRVEVSERLGGCGCACSSGRVEVSNGCCLGDANAFANRSSDVVGGVAAKFGVVVTNGEDHVLFSAAGEVHQEL